MTREEIAKELAGHLTVPMHVLDAVRALPVITTCGECGWRSVPRGDGPSRCENARLPSPPPIIERDAAPPGWCPLRGKR